MNDSQMTKLAAGVRQLAAMLDANPEFEDVFRHTRMTVNVFVRGGENDDPAEQMADLVRAGLRSGGTVQKHANDDYMWAAIQFGPVELHVNATRDEVCERVVVGTETVTKKVKDPEALAAVPEVEVTEVVEKVEWVCRPLLAAEAGGES